MNFILLRSVLKILLSSIIFVCTLNAGLLVKRVEPPTWWNDFDNRKLEIMIYGENMGSVRTVEIYHKPRGLTETIRINKIKRTIDAAKALGMRDKEIKAMKDDYASKQYQRDRAENYASLADQMDMQYWDAKNGTTTWQDHIDKVKSDFPKK